VEESLVCGRVSGVWKNVWGGEESLVFGKVISSLLPFSSDQKHPLPLLFGTLPLPPSSFILKTLLRPELLFVKPSKSLAREFWF
jgi:hypothetical protein